MALTPRQQDLVLDAVRLRTSQLRTQANSWRVQARKLAAPYPNDYDRIADRFLDQAKELDLAADDIIKES